MLRHASRIRRDRHHDTVVTLSVPKGDQRSWFGKLTMTRAVRVTLSLPKGDHRTERTDRVTLSLPKGDHRSWFGKLTMTSAALVTLSSPA